MKYAFLWRVCDLVWCRCNFGQRVTSLVFGSKKVTSIALWAVKLVFSTCFEVVSEWYLYLPEAQQLSQSIFSQYDKHTDLQTDT